MTDVLTQLASKPQLLDWLDAAPEGSMLALIDLDDFRLLNQSLGHDVGDEALRLVAQRLRGVFPEPDHRVARLSQDEFAVLSTLERDDPAQLASRAVDVFAAPFRIGERTVRIRATSGITVRRATAEPNDVIREADTAMYEAKAQAKGRSLTFADELHTRASEMFELSEGLRHALVERHLHVHYQPELDLQTGEVRGAEALLRWTHPERGAVPPDHFIPIAETTELIDDLGRFVLTTALAQRARWITDGVIDDGFMLAVNLSPRQLDDPRLVDLVARELTLHGCPPERLCLELTEGAVMSDTVVSIEQLDRLADLGVHLAIDDFGTGYSSLAYLQQLPVTTLKIDRSFVSRAESPKGVAIITAIMGIATALDLMTVAEGIETEAQESILTELGCTLGQGYLFSRPVAPEEFAEMVSGAPLTSSPTR